MNAGNGNDCGDDYDMMMAMMMMTMKMITVEHTMYASVYI